MKAKSGSFYVQWNEKKKKKKKKEKKRKKKRLYLTNHWSRQIIDYVQLRQSEGDKNR